jgi:hypothetical protein
MRTAIRASFFVALAAGGCSREYLSPAFGRANRDALAMQAVAPAKPPPPPSMKLDTQEAAVISGAYVHSLSGKTSQREPEPLLFVSPQQQGSSPQLAPSVPKY